MRPLGQFVLLMIALSVSTADARWTTMSSDDPMTDVRQRTAMAAGRFIQGGTDYDIPFIAVHCTSDLRLDIAIGFGDVVDDDYPLKLRFDAFDAKQVDYSVGQDLTTVFIKGPVVEIVDSLMAGSIVRVQAKRWVGTTSVAEFSLADSTQSIRWACEDSTMPVLSLERKKAERRLTLPSDRKEACKKAATAEQIQIVEIDELSHDPKKSNVRIWGLDNDDRAFLFICNFGPDSAAIETVYANRNYPRGFRWNR